MFNQAGYSRSTYGLWYILLSRGDTAYRAIIYPDHEHVMLFGMTASMLFDL